MQTHTWQAWEGSLHLYCNSHPHSNPIAQNNQVTYIVLVLLFVPGTLALPDHIPCQCQEQSLGFMGNTSLLSNTGGGIGRADNIGSVGLFSFFFFFLPKIVTQVSFFFFFLVTYYRKKATKLRAVLDGQQSRQKSYR